MKNKEFLNNFGIIGIVGSGIIFLIYTIVGHYSFNLDKKSGIYFTIGTILLLIGIILWIKRQITLKYRHDELIRQLELAETDLEKEHVAKLKAEEENSKRATIIHKFEDRLDAAEESMQMLAEKLSNNMNTEFGAEISEVTQIIQNLSKDLADEKKKELTSKHIIQKTNIPGIDSIIQHYYNKSRKNEIELEFELKCNMQEFIQNTVEEGKIITLLKDHLQDAIIAINHSKETNKKIKLVIQKVNEIYEICVYDTGIEFEIDTLLKLGKEQVTTHKDTGGSGIGFVTTFETLRKARGSLIIEEYENSESGFSKGIILRFDGKGEYKICSYRSDQIGERKTNNKIILEKYNGSINFDKE